MPPAEKTSANKPSKLTAFFKPSTPYHKPIADKSVGVNGNGNTAERETKVKKADIANYKPSPEEEQSLEFKTMGFDWYVLLRKEFDTPYFKKIKEFLKQEQNNKKVVFPTPENIYSWSRYTTFDNIKVVILGQDPYHNTGQAHGLAFSVLPGNAVPPSLRNIYQAIHEDYPAEFPKPLPNTGYLENWAKQGVLMLNATLTVEAHKANSHSAIGWDTFTDHVIELISNSKSNVVFLLWGSYAQKKARSRIDKTRHLVLTSVHPSPLSAHKGFFQCHHFRKANEYLAKHGRTTIKWQDL